MSVAFSKYLVRLLTLCDRGDEASIFRWKSKGAPLDDPEAMLVFQANEKSRTRVSKSNHRRTNSPKTRATPQPHATCGQPELEKTKIDFSHIEIEKHVR